MGLNKALYYPCNWASDYSNFPWMMNARTALFMEMPPSMCNGTALEGLVPGGERGELYHGEAALSLVIPGPASQPLPQRCTLNPKP